MTMTQSQQARQSWREMYPVHPAADLFPMMSAAELDVLAADIKKNGLEQPIVLFRDTAKCTQDERDYDIPLLVLDGRNRLEALQRAGIPIPPPANIAHHLASGLPYMHGAVYFRINRSHVWSGGTNPKNWTQRVECDPWAYVLGANIHRRHLTADQKRDLIAAVLKATPERSNRETAKLVKVDDKTVGSVRRKLEATADIPQLTKTTGKDGKQRPTRRPVKEPTPKPEVTRAAAVELRPAPTPCPSPTSTPAPSASPAAPAAGQTYTVQETTAALERLIAEGHALRDIYLVADRLCARYFAERKTDVPKRWRRKELTALVVFGAFHALERADRIAANRAAGVVGEKAGSA